MRFAVRCLLWIGAAALADQASALTLEELQEELAKHPEAKWSAGDTDVHARFAGKESLAKFGMSPSYLPHLASRRGAASAPRFDLPRSIDWRNKDGVNWMSPISNQGDCGSCVAFAAVGLLEGVYNIAAHAPGLNVRFSQQDLLSRIGTCDQGSMPDIAMDVMSQTGVPDAACFPYTSGRAGKDVDKSKTCADLAARAIKITSFKETYEREEVKAWLQQGPVLAGMSVYEDFLFYKGGIYKHVTGGIEGGHAVVLVGYDDDARAWIVRNSWGADWGEHGYFRVSYDDDGGVGDDGFAITVNPPDNDVKIVSPAPSAAVSGQVSLKLESLAHGALDAPRYAIEQSGSTAVIDGAFDPSTMTASLDTSSLADGIYVLKATAAVGGKASRPWYELIEVVNHPQNLALALAPDFNNSGPIKDYVYFKLDVTGGSAPLTVAALQIHKTDGTLDTALTFPDPGPESELGWRTTLVPNGDYKISVQGKIGDLQQFRSNELTVNVAN